MRADVRKLLEEFIHLPEDSQEEFKAVLEGLNEPLGGLDLRTPEGMAEFEALCAEAAQEDADTVPAKDFLLDLRLQFKHP
jgi:hypothetical protein